jgi:peptidyl-prolyl cis-trans isomerase SurA
MVYMDLRVLFATLAAFCFGVTAAEVKVIEQIVAKVNGDIITRSEIERTKMMMRAQLQQERVPPEKAAAMLAERESDILRDQIDNLLLVQKAKELGISVDSEVTRELAEIQSQNKIPDPDKFRVWVEEQSGMPFEDLKQQLRNGRLTRRVIQQEVGGRVTIPTAEMEKYYEEHKAEFMRQEQIFLREILVLAQGNPPDWTAAEKKARDVLARAKKGEKFPELARDMSDAETAKNFGEIGWFKREQLIPELQTLFNQNRNYITDLIKFPNGFGIYKVEEKHEAGQAPFEDVQNEIHGRLMEERMRPRVREYLTKLRGDAFLEIREGYVDSAPAPDKDTAWKDPAQLRPETTTKEEVARSRRKRLLWVIPWKTEAIEEEPETNTPARAPSTAGPEAPKPDPQ